MSDDEGRYPEMTNTKKCSVMEVISPLIATVATPQTTELRESMAKVAILRRKLSGLQATGRHRSNNRSNRKTQARSHSPSLHTSMHQARKWLSQQLGATSIVSPTQSRLHVFYVTDRASGLKFLIDTGAEVSVVPRSHTSENSKGSSLQAINNTSIPIRQSIHPHVSNIHVLLLTERL